MVISTYINTNYIANKTRYIKVCIEFPKRGMFSAICNCKTNSVQIGKCVYANQPYKRYRIMGQGECKMVFSIKELMKNIGDYSQTDIQQIRKCLINLNRSFAKYVIDDPLTYDECCEVKEFLDKMWFEFHNPCGNGNSNDNNTADDDKAIASDSRNLIATAKMVNANGLADFVNGNFYNIATTKNGNEEFDVVRFNEQIYIGLLDDNGIVHYNCVLNWGGPSAFAFLNSNEGVDFNDITNTLKYTNIVGMVK